MTPLQQQLGSSRQILVAYSGGLDSSVLLHQLVLLREQCPALRVRAIHVHHGLSPCAEQWVSHCQQQCAGWQVPLTVVRVKVNARGKGTEAAAREVRYQAFIRHLEPGEALVTAQHQDDQCETLLLALKRGSGPAGLSAMPASRPLGEHRLIRPLLSQRRQQLEQWALQHQLRWIEDESNQDTHYDRNFLRQQIIPQLQARWPSWVPAVARSAALCAEQEQLLDELLAESLAQLLRPDGSLLIKPLFTMSIARRAALLRRWIAYHGGKMPARAALQRINDEILGCRMDASPCLRLGQHEIRRYRDALYWLPVVTPVLDCQLAWLPPWLPLTLPGQLGQLVQHPEGTECRLPRDDEQVLVRFQAQGYFHIVGRYGGRPLKKLWQELAVPPWQRTRTPLIFYNDCLIAAPGLFVTCDGAAGGQSGRWRIRWLQYTSSQVNAPF